MYPKTFLLLVLAGLSSTGSSASGQSPGSTVGPSGTVTVTTQPVAPTPVETRSATGQQQLELVPIGPATTYQMQNAQGQGIVGGVIAPNGNYSAPQNTLPIQPIGQLPGLQYGTAFPPTVINTPGNVLTQGIPVPFGGGPLTSAVAQPTVAVTNLYGPQPVVGQQTQIYTPTYYYYYYQPPYYNTVTPIAQPQMMYGADGSMGGMSASQFGPMINGRGEMGHVRYPYYSYRRPWYFPGQPSFNVTIEGPAW